MTSSYPDHEDRRLLVKQRLTFPVDPQRPGQARLAVRQVLIDSGHSDWSDAAELAVTELVTNAAIHAQPPVELAIVMRSDRLRVEVRDSSPQIAVLSSDHGGRGLDLVQELASSCGVTLLPDGKIVWFEFADVEPNDDVGVLLDVWGDDGWGITEEVEAEALPPSEPLPSRDEVEPHEPDEPTVFTTGEATSPIRRVLELTRVATRVAAARVNAIIEIEKAVSQALQLVPDDAEAAEVVLVAVQRATSSGLSYEEALSAAKESPVSYGERRLVAQVLPLVEREASARRVYSGPKTTEGGTHEY